MAWDLLQRRRLPGGRGGVSACGGRWSRSSPVRVALGLEEAQQQLAVPPGRTAGALQARSARRGPARPELLVRTPRVVPGQVGSAGRNRMSGLSIPRPKPHSSPPSALNSSAHEPVLRPPRRRRRGREGDRGSRPRPAPSAREEVRQRPRTAFDRGGVDDAGAVGWSGGAPAAVPACPPRPGRGRRSVPGWAVEGRLWTTSAFGHPATGRGCPR